MSGLSFCKIYKYFLFLLTNLFVCDKIELYFLGGKLTMQNKGKLSKVLMLTLCSVLMLGLFLTGCSSKSDSNDNSAILIKDTKAMNDSEFMEWIQSYATSAKPINTLFKVVDAKMSSIADENKQSIREMEWVNIIYNIAKYQDLMDTYSYGLSFNDDGTFNYEESKKTINDPVFNSVYEDGIKNNNLELMWKNDAVYVTTDVLSFKNRISQNVSDAFKDYLDVVNKCDETYFIKDGKVFYDNIESCLIFEQDFLSKHLDDQLWDTVFQQYYSQSMMYLGLYGTGGFGNDDGTLNETFYDTINAAIERNKDSKFGILMSEVVAQVKVQTDFSLDALDVILSSAMDKAFGEELAQYNETFKENADQTTTINPNAPNEPVNEYVISDGNTTSATDDVAEEVDSVE